MDANHHIDFEIEAAREASDLIEFNKLRARLGVGLTQFEMFRFGMALGRIRALEEALGDIDKKTSEVQS